MRQQKRAKEPRIGVAIAASLVLHLAVLAFAYHYAFGPVANPPPERSSQGIEIVFTEAAPLSSSEPVAEIDTDVFEEPIQVLETTEQNSEHLERTGQDLLLSETEQNMELADRQEVIPEIEKNDGRMVGEGISSIQLNAAVSAYMQHYRQEINQDWLEECTRFKKQNIGEECPLGQNYAVSLNPVSLQIMTPMTPEPLAPGEFSAQESFKMMTEGDLFNPYMLSGELPILGTGGGVLNLLVGATGLANPQLILPVSAELRDRSTVKNIERANVAITEKMATDFVIRPALF